MSDEDATNADVEFAAVGPGIASMDEVDDILGEVLDGRYEVIARLGAGGMGYVFEARHVQLNHSLVLKTLRPELLSSGTVTERFTREAQSATRISHPHVIDVKDFGVHPRFGAYYVMERLDGRDLEHVLRTESPLSIPRALKIIEQVAGALGAAHAKGIIHRDLKPANVYLIQQGYDPDYVKVLDFGLAKVMDANRKLTETGQVIGTPRYMAPEQCAGEKVDSRADVFSAALILWEMLTGVQPFEKLGTYEILGKKMFEDMPAPSELDPPVQLPAQVERFLMTCLSKDPAWRPADGNELLDQLKRLSSDLTHATGPVQPPAPEAERVTAPPGSPPSGAARGLIAAGLVVALLGAGTGVGLLLWLRQPATPPPPAPTPVAPVATIPDPVPVPPEPPAVDTMVVTVRSEPPGAQVSLGPRALGVTPLDVRVPDDVPAGAEVRITMDGFASRSITIVHGVPTAHVRLHLER